VQLELHKFEAGGYGRQEASAGLQTLGRYSSNIQTTMSETSNYLKENGKIKNTNIL